MTMRFPGCLAGIFIFAAAMHPSLVMGQDAPGAVEVQGTASGDDADYMALSVFTRALELIRQDYVDENKVSFHDLTYGAMSTLR